MACTARVHNREEIVELSYAISKRVCQVTQYILVYLHIMLTRPYWHLTFVALIEPHQIMCILHNISILIVGFRDVHAHSDWILYKLSETNLPPFSKSFLAIWQIVCSLFKPFSITLFSNIVWRSTVIKCWLWERLKTACKTAAILYVQPISFVHHYCFICNFTSTLSNYAILLAHYINAC